MAAERIATVTSGEVDLAVYEWAPADRPVAGRQGGGPTVLLVHGYPDTHAVWGPVAEQLAPDLRVLAHDVRGAGASSAPAGRDGYRIDALVDDILAVREAVAPGARVHLVGHDWGSIQSWHAVTGDRAPGAIASYTSISGPCLDHVGHWARDALGSGSPRRWLRLADQLRRSWYIWWYQIPVLAPLAWRLGWDRLLTRVVTGRAGVAPSPPGTPTTDRWPAPTLAGDGRRGIGLYRANVLPRLLRPEERHTDLPVQVILPTDDPYVSPDLADVDRWVDHPERRTLAAGHWAVRSHPEQVAGWVRQLVREVAHQA